MIFKESNVRSFAMYDICGEKVIENDCCNDVKTSMVSYDCDLGDCDSFRFDTAFNLESEDCYFSNYLIDYLRWYSILVFMNDYFNFNLRDFLCVSKYKISIMEENK